MKFVLLAVLVGVCLTGVTWPSPSSTKAVAQPIRVRAGQTFDGFKENQGKWVRYERGRAGYRDCVNIDGRKTDAVFILGKVATLKNVILGPYSIKHVYCEGDGCTIENVWWEDVCRSAITFENSSNTAAKFYVKGGGARNGSFKIIQHNSAGTVYINDFYAENSGQLYSSCENCHIGYQGKRSVVMTNVTSARVGALAGYNPNYGDVVTLKDVKVIGGGHACRAFQGRDDGKESTPLRYTCDGSSISSCVCK